MRRLTTVRNSVEATLLQQALDLEGVNSFLTNEHTATLFPHWYGLLGHGIQIMVSDDDYEKAKDILARREKELQVRSCPNCGSTAIGFGIRAKRDWSSDSSFSFHSSSLLCPWGISKTSTTVRIAGPTLNEGESGTQTIC